MIGSLRSFGWQFFGGLLLAWLLVVGGPLLIIWGTLSLIDRYVASPMTSSATPPAVCGPP